MERSISISNPILCSYHWRGLAMGWLFKVPGTSSLASYGAMVCLPSLSSLMSQGTRVSSERRVLGPSRCTIQGSDFS